MVNTVCYLGLLAVAVLTIVCMLKAVLSLCVADAGVNGGLRGWLLWFKSKFGANFAQTDNKASAHTV